MVTNSSSSPVAQGVRLANSFVNHTVNERQAVRIALGMTASFFVLIIVAVLLAAPSAAPSGGIALEDTSAARIANW